MLIILGRVTSALWFWPDFAMESGAVLSFAGMGMMVGQNLSVPEEPAGRGLCTEELDFSLGVTEEFKDSCVRKHPYFKYSSLQTRDRSGFIYGLIIFLPVL